MQEYLCYTDASCRPEGSVGAYIVKQENKTIAQQAVKLTSKSAPLAENEILGILLDYVNKNLPAKSSVALRTDSQSIADYINNANSKAPTHLELKQKYKNLAEKFDLSIRFICRDENNEADELCRTYSFRKASEQKPAPKTKAAPKAKKPTPKCVFCAAPASKNAKRPSSDIISVWMQDGTLQIIAAGLNGPVSTQIGINYCPICGKKMSPKK